MNFCRMKSQNAFKGKNVLVCHIFNVSTGGLKSIVKSATSFPILLDIMKNFTTNSESTIKKLQENLCKPPNITVYLVFLPSTFRLGF